MAGMIYTGEAIFTRDCTRELEGKQPKVRKIFKVVQRNDTGEYCCDLRDYLTSHPTRKGVRLPLPRWATLKGIVDVVNEKIALVKDEVETFYQCHIGGNVYVTVKSPYWVVDIRHYWMPSNGKKVLPGAKGVSLKLDEWGKLTACFKDLEEVLPEARDVVPCYAQDDHQNQLGYLFCGECNPNYTGQLEVDEESEDTVDNPVYHRDEDNRLVKGYKL